MKLYNQRKERVNMHIATLFESMHSMIDEETLKPIIDMKKEELEKYGLTIQDVLETCDLLSIEADRLYHESTNFVYPFCYWDGFYFKSFLTLKPEALTEIGDDKRFKEQKKQMHEYITEQNWDAVLTFCDKKVSFPVLSYVMKFAPKNKHAEMFIDTYTRNEYGFDRINPDMVRSALSEPAGGAYDISLAEENPDVNGYYTVYRGNTEKSTTLDKAYSWTLSREVAYFFATRFNSVGIIYVGKVHKDKIRAYINSRSEKEVLVLPEDVILNEGAITL